MATLNDLYSINKFNITIANSPNAKGRDAAAKAAFAPYSDLLEANNKISALQQQIARLNDVYNSTSATNKATQEEQRALAASWGQMANDAQASALQRAAAYAQQGQANEAARMAIMNNNPLINGTARG